MKKIAVLCFILLSSLSSFALQHDEKAEAILDKVAENFKKSGAIKMSFKVLSFTNNRLEGEASGDIRLKGDKFNVQTDDMEIWFDGKTQWSYAHGSGEVNVSSPSPDELQSVNPYTFLYLYKHGYTCKLGKLTTFRGKPIYQVILTSTDRKQDLACIVLHLSKENYQPIYVLLQQRGNKQRSEITITNYQQGLSFADTLFVYDQKKYPDVDIIDLR